MVRNQSVIHILYLLSKTNCFWLEKIKIHFFDIFSRNTYLKGLQNCVEICFRKFYFVETKPRHIDVPKQNCEMHRHNQKHVLHTWDQRRNRSSTQEAVSCCSIVVQGTVLRKWRINYHLLAEFGHFYGRRSCFSSSNTTVLFCNYKSNRLIISAKP